MGLSNQSKYLTGCQARLISSLSSRLDVLVVRTFPIYVQHSLLHGSKNVTADKTFRRSSKLPTWNRSEARHINGPPRPSSNDSGSRSLSTFCMCHSIDIQRSGKSSENFFPFASFLHRSHRNYIGKARLLHITSHQIWSIHCHGLDNEKCKSVAEDFERQIWSLFRRMADATWEQPF
jgi:hypothetical protein